VIEGWRQELEQALLGLFPMLPRHLLAALRQPENSSQFSLPLIERHRSESKRFGSSSVIGFISTIFSPAADPYASVVYYIVHHMKIVPRHHSQEEACLDLGNMSYMSSPIGKFEYCDALIGFNYMTGLLVSFAREIINTNVVVLIGSPKTTDFIALIQKHYCDDSYRRWKRLGRNLTHMIPDMFYLFTDWAPALASLKGMLQDAEMRSMSGSVPVTVRTRILHYQIATVIELREVLRFHQAVIDQTLHSRLPVFGGAADTVDQLKRMARQMDHNAITLDTVKDQLANLIQLVSQYPFTTQPSIAGMTTNTFTRSLICLRYQRDNQFPE
jgi:hypothetical protein